jgi:hypothetical protein
MLKKNLVVLRYAQNTGYANVVKLSRVESESRLEVDVTTGTWRIGASDSRKIGEGMVTGGYGSGGEIIGVYDRTITKHLDNMVGDASEATHPRSNICGDD